MKYGKTIQLAVMLLFGLYAFRTNAAITIRPALNLGLVGYWGMDEGYGNQVFDQSGYRNNGTASGSPTWVDGKLGEGLSFDGTDDYINAGDPANSSLDMGLNDWTISAWINTEGSTSGQIVNKKSTNSTVGYNLFYNPGTEGIWATIGSGNTGVISGTIATSTWVHIVAVFDRDVSGRIYVDGSASGNPQYAVTSYIGEDQANTNNFSIGARQMAGSNDAYFDGKIDEVRIYNRALSAGEVTRLYNLTRTMFKAASSLGLVGYWAMDEGQGTIAGDMSGRGNNGIFSGNPVWLDGKRGKALSFSGSGNYIETNASSPINNLSSFSISMWVNPRNEATYPRAIAKMQWALIFDDSSPATTNGITFYRATNGSTLKVQTVDNSWTPNVWQHVVLTTNGLSAFNTHIYINGTETSYQTQDSGTGLANSDDGQGLSIGAHAGGEYPFDGSIDEVRIYNRALSASEVANLYTSSKKIFKVSASQNNKLTDGLVGMWSFNGPDISGVTAYDRSSSGNNGTITGATIAIGKVGQALSFDGTADYVLVSGSASLDDLATATISMWFNVSDDGKLLVKDEGNTAALDIYTYPDRRLQLTRKYNGGSHLARLCAADSFQFNQWTHLAGVYSGPSYSNLHIYIDGQECTYGGQSDGTGSLMSETGGGLTINSNASPSIGKMDEVRIYNRSLSAEEIRRLYKMGK